MNAATVGQIEAGRLAPYPIQVLKLANALGLRGGEIALIFGQDLAQAVTELRDPSSSRELVRPASPGSPPSEQGRQP